MRLQVDYAATGSCSSCTAPTADFCNAFGVSSHKTLLAVTVIAFAHRDCAELLSSVVQSADSLSSDLLQGAVTVFSMAIPVIFSLIALLKLEVASGLHLTNRVAQALAIVHQQLIHLNAHEDLRCPLDHLMVAILPNPCQSCAMPIEVCLSYVTALQRNKCWPMSLISQS